MVVLALNFYFHAPIVDPCADDLWPINRHARISNKKKTFASLDAFNHSWRYDDDGVLWWTKVVKKKNEPKTKPTKKCSKRKGSTCRVNTCALQIVERKTMGAKMTIVNRHLFNIRHTTATATCSAAQCSLQLPHLRFQLVCESQLVLVFRKEIFRVVFGHNSYSHSYANWIGSSA